MDSKSFTQTSFCDIMVDNITTNKDKEYILSQLNIMCNKRYTDRYAKVYNPKFINNLKNPHIICLKSSGTPYLMYITQICNKNYTFLIDKKIKNGYDFPKIFIIPISFTNEVYENTLLECELIRDNDKKWYISIGDSYYMRGKNTKKTVIVDRINDIIDMLNNNLLEGDFMKSCKIQVKKYFDYKDISYINREFIPLLPYNIRGYYIVPICPDYSKILYLIDNKANENYKMPITDKHNKHNKNIGKSHILNKSKNTFRVVKTVKPDVYDLLKKVDGDYKREGILLVQTLEESHKLGEYFRDKTVLDEVFIECSYDNYFNKWKFSNFI